MSLPRATLRLAALVAAAVAVLSLAGMALQYRLVADRLHAGQVALLAADMEGLGALYDQRRIIALRQAIDYRLAAGGPGLLLLLGKQGQVLAGNLAEWPGGVPRTAAGFTPEGAAVFTVDGARHLGVARDLPGGFALLVAHPLAAADATLAALRRGIAGIALAMLAAGAAVGWLAARRIMARIRAINALADRVAAGDLDARLPGPRAGDEFGLLETHVHAMLDRIGNLNRATHRLSDTIAHELRTPLNRMLQKLTRIAGQETVVDDLRAEMRATIRIFDSLLDISRAEADAGAGGLVPVDLSALAAEVWDLYEPLAEDRGLTPAAEIAPDLWILGDRTLIAQALANLLDNAVKFCRPGDALRLTLRAEGGRQVLALADTGPGMPADLRATALDRFTRAGRDRAVAGHGLGLALVRAIAVRHGARLELPPVAQGFAVEIGWPPLPPEARG
ncbi:HAMP domain-containing sensor histidine kinase [Ruixingdingia sedimenti]|uniref:histidine kinase n=1 Tax=Ruixingdingia sedimenti TaxID=3073604 RepID=A0ABU1F566_9RHOB|nr:HAMP domain-containing sensor histidine kinase [Xinfangfangia sp. LG-4]MDR5652008.1 HAMP domain-containing sensor histidine kinase [Xinfangfangia sp. LG-4]